MAARWYGSPHRLEILASRSIPLFLFGLASAVVTPLAAQDGHRPIVTIRTLPAARRPQPSVPPAPVIRSAAPAAASGRRHAQNPRRRKPRTLRDSPASRPNAASAPAEAVVASSGTPPRPKTSERPVTRSWKGGRLARADSATPDRTEKRRPAGRRRGSSAEATPPTSEMLPASARRQSSRSRERRVRLADPGRDHEAAQRRTGEPERRRGETQRVVTSRDAPAAPPATRRLLATTTGSAPIPAGSTRRRRRQPDGPAERQRSGRPAQIAATTGRSRTPERDRGRRTRTGGAEQKVRLVAAAPGRHESSRSRPTKRGDSPGRARDTSSRTERAESVRTARSSEPDGLRTKAAPAAGRPFHGGMVRPVSALGRIGARRADRRAAERNAEGERLLRRGQYRAAENAFRRGIAQLPNQPTYGFLLYNLACSLLGGGDADEARVTFARAARNLPREFNPRRRIAAAVRHFNGKATAEAANRAGKTARPDEKHATAASQELRGAAGAGDEARPVAALNRRAERLLNQGRFIAAERVLRSALKQKASAPMRATIYYNLGWSRQEQGRQRDAIRPLRKAAALSPKRSAPRRRLAMAYRTTQRAGRTDISVGGPGSARKNSSRRSEQPR